MGDEFLDSYGRLQGVTKELKVDLADAPNADLSDVRKTSIALREFLASLMLPESAEVFIRREVRAPDGTTISVQLTPEAAGLLPSRGASGS
ncbi:hypothetical protein ABZ938_24305 [Streptomyces sp. NPDC046409]|uniref:hypothetical protein n=1 Tax=Streptomyces sp. NPDC046409 TaxID=3156675 RepID=UPI0033F8886A